MKLIKMVVNGNTIEASKTALRKCWLIPQCKRVLKEWEEEDAAAREQRIALFGEDVIW